MLQWQNECSLGKAHAGPWILCSRTLSDRGSPCRLASSLPVRREHREMRPPGLVLEHRSLAERFHDQLLQVAPKQLEAVPAQMLGILRFTILPESLWPVRQHHHRPSRQRLPSTSQQDGRIPRGANGFTEAGLNASSGCF